MPAFFIGHGNPMNAIEENQFTRGWKDAVADVPKPKAILCVSAHWLTRGTFVTAMKRPRTIHDFGGFPKELFATEYPAPGDPKLAETISRSSQAYRIELDHSWGLDHGSWSILKPLFPDADVPVLELSIDYHRPGDWHYSLGRELRELRKKGVLIIGSGNMVHNLGKVDFKMKNTGFDWAIEANELFKSIIESGDHKPLFDYQKLGKEIALAVPTPDHYYPLLYALGLQTEADQLTIFNDQVLMGSLTMTSVKIDC